MLAIIGGTGLTELEGLRIVSIDSLTTHYGDVVVQQGEYAGRNIVFLPRHGAGHHELPHTINYRANIKALQQLGVEQIVAVNAVGGINANMQTQDLVLPHQLIDYTWGREISFAEPGQILHIDFTQPFSESLREQLLEAAAISGIKLHSQAVYAVTQGPRLETAAEVERLARDGCDIVGMTAMPEAALARELNIEYACLSLVVNPAAGCSSHIITMEQIQTAIDQGMQRVRALLVALLGSM